ncbi:MAG: hypothetical protein WC346_18830 [Methanogenium sp.]|jgi:hypothetical protein
MGKVVAFINGVPNLIYFDFKGETPQKYRYLSWPKGGWTNLIKKEETIYCGEETEELQSLKEEYQKTVEEILRQKQIQKEIIEKVNHLSSNENTLYNGKEEL